MTDEPVPGRGRLARALRRGAPKNQGEAGAKVNGEARGESPARKRIRRAVRRPSASGAAGEPEAR